MPAVLVPAFVLQCQSGQAFAALLPSARGLG
jgi:hypothetical protein